MSVRYGSMYERLIKSLEEATELAVKLRDTVDSDGLYIITPEIDARIARCQQTIRAGKALVEVQNLDYRDYLEVKRLLKERKDAKDA